MASGAQSNPSIEKLGGFVAGFIMPGAREIERVYVSADEWKVHIWSVVNNISEERIHNVNHCEELLIDRFPDVQFDFHVIDRHDHSADHLVPGAEIVFTR
jgi:hypothetical protein